MVACKYFSPDENTVNNHPNAKMAEDYKFNRPLKVSSCCHPVLSEASAHTTTCFYVNNWSACLYSESEAMNAIKRAQLIGDNSRQQVLLYEGRNSDGVMSINLNISHLILTSDQDGVEFDSADIRSFDIEQTVALAEQEFDSYIRSKLETDRFSSVEDIDLDEIDATNNPTNSYFRKVTTA